MASTDGPHLEEPTYWFAILEAARERDDFERAAAAMGELRRLGVSVRYSRSDRESKPNAETESKTVAPRD